MKETLEELLIRKHNASVSEKIEVLQTEKAQMESTISSIERNNSLDEFVVTMFLAVLSTLFGFACLWLGEKEVLLNGLLTLVAIIAFLFTSILVLFAAWMFSETIAPRKQNKQLKLKVLQAEHKIKELRRKLIS